MVRFFVKPGELTGDLMTLTGDSAKHGYVLRLKAGEPVMVSDGAGAAWRCQVVSCSADALTVEVLERGVSGTEAAVAVSVYMAFAKADKLEHVIQKATELGASEIVAFPSSRCVVKSDEKTLLKKLERWQKIAASAAEQSGRDCIPQVLTVGSYKEALERAAAADLALMFFEHEQSRTLKQALQTGPFHSVSILTGPEGGLEDREVEQARQAGLQVCTLGKRILRCETAPLCALSAIMYEAGEF